MGVTLNTLGGMVADVEMTTDASRLAACDVSIVVVPFQFLTMEMLKELDLGVDTWLEAGVGIFLLNCCSIAKGRFR